MKELLTALVLCSTMLFAQNNNYDYEITPMLGGVNAEGNLDLDDQQLYGISIGKNLDEDSIFDQVELGILNSTNTDYIIGGEDTYITRIFANLINEYEMNETVSLYSLVGLGYETFSNEKYENDDEGFANYGLGLKFKLSESVSLKTDVRHLINFHGDNNLLYTLGLGISFGEKAKSMSVKKEIIKEEPPILDDDKDGVVNSKDKYITTPLVAKVDKHGSAVTVNLHINFDTDSSIIKNSYENKIQEFANFLKKYPLVRAKIEAHTDATGSKKYNQKLSQRRATSTVKALVGLDIDVSRLEAIGYGELKPVESNATKEGRASNRRVEAVIIK